MAFRFDKLTQKAQEAVQRAQEIAADAGIGEGDHDLEAHGGYDERLVIGETDAEEEEGPE